MAGDQSRHPIGPEDLEQVPAPVLAAWATMLAERMFRGTPQTSRARMREIASRSGNPTEAWIVAAASATSPDDWDLAGRWLASLLADHRARQQAAAGDTITHTDPAPG